jgi:hypothetical protein
MMVIGERLYGYCDSVGGEFHVATKFFHVWFVPCFPMSSYIVLEEGDNTWRGVQIGFSIKSIVFAWARAGLVLSALGRAHRRRRDALRRRDRGGYRPLARRPRVRRRTLRLVPALEQRLARPSARAPCQAQRPGFVRRSAAGQPGAAAFAAAALALAASRLAALASAAGCATALAPATSCPAALAAATSPPAASPVDAPAGRSDASLNVAVGEGPPARHPGGPRASSVGAASQAAGDRVDLDWRLLTNKPVRTWKDTAALVRAYLGRRRRDGRIHGRPYGRAKLHLLVQRRGDVGSPRVAGDIRRSRASTKPGCWSATVLGPPPGRRTWPRATVSTRSGFFRSRRPATIVWRARPVARATKAMPPRPRAVASTADQRRTVASLRTGQRE